VKLLLVCHGYPPFGIAGVERLSAQTAGALTERRHRVTVLTRRPTSAPPTLALERDVRGGVPVVTVVGGGSTFGLFPGNEAEMERAFTRMLAETAPDAVLLTHLLHHSPRYVELAHAWGIPALLELHDFFAMCPLAHLQRVSGERCGGPEGGAACAVHCFPQQESAGGRWALRAHSFRHALASADAVIAPSRFVAEAFAPLRGTQDPIEVLPNGVPSYGPLERHPPRRADAPLRLASIGVLTQHKGFDVVVEALRRASLGAVQYTIFGLAAEPSSSELRAAAANVPGLSLRLFGAFDPPDLPALLGDVDALLVPSLVAETYSIAAREAMACGVPVVASRLGALPEAVRHGDNGLLFVPGDASELAALLQRLAEEPGLRQRLAAGVSPRDWITVDERTVRLERLIETIVRTGARGRTSEDTELRLMRDAFARNAA
jgi:glycosyltransferase involved in cell wall biosynthesis